MSTEGTSDVLLDMSATIPHAGTPTSDFKVKPREVEYIVPFDDRIVVLPDAAEEMIGSFYVPDVAQERPSRGTIVAIGDAVDLTVFSEGMRVIYGHFTGSECMHGGEECLIMRVADLYGAVRTEVVG